jgi:hypothetical protein
MGKQFIAGTRFNKPAVFQHSNLVHAHDRTRG